MQAIVDFAIKRNCWNFYESYGEICVGCGCCSKDKATRYKARYELCKRLIEDMVSFDGWFDDPKLRDLQERNVASSLKHFRRRIAYYKKRLKELK